MFGYGSSRTICEGGLFKIKVDSEIREIYVPSFLNVLEVGWFDNDLEKLDIPYGSELFEIHCTNCKLKDLTLNEKMRFVNCYNNQLETLENINENIVYLDCANNNLTKLDIPYNNSLRYLRCDAGLLDPIIFNVLQNDCEVEIVV
jgi:hypothetical protein